MADDRGVVREIAWLELFPWLLVLRAFRMAIQLKFLLVATCGVLLTIFGWWLFSLLFERAEEVPLAAWIGSYQSCPWTDPSHASQAGRVQIPQTGPPRLGRYPGDAFVAPWSQLKAPFQQLFDWGLGLRGLAFLLLCCLWALAVWALAGGILTRMAALQLAREERLGLRPATRYAASKWLSYFTAPLFPMLGILLCVLPMLVVGLVMKLDVGALAAAALWPLMLLGGLLMAILLLGLLFGWPLMWPTISSEGTDSFDALSRSYSYVYHRPLHYLWYAAVATLLGLLGWLLAAWFAEAVAYLPLWAASWGSNQDRMNELLAGGAALESAPARWAANVLFFWNGCVRLVALGFVYSYFWTASTAIYFLLRRDDDGTEMDEVHLEAADEPRELPPLATDAAGVPVAVDGDEATPSDIAEAERPPDEPG